MTTTFHVERPVLQRRLRGYAELLRSSPHDLMSPRALAELEQRHLPEALALAERLPAGRVADVGSGGGVPGMVVALARPDCEVTLIEATAKKARFLAAAAEALAVPVTVSNARVEALHGELAGAFDALTARAVAPLDRLLAWTLPLLAEGGELFAVKGARWRDELAAAQRALGRLGGQLVACPPDPRAFDDRVDPPLRVVIIARGYGGLRRRDGAG